MAEGPWEVKDILRAHVQGHPEPSTFVAIERAGYVAGGGVALVAHRGGDANARLIAAAPVLLEACRAAAWHIHRGHGVPWATCQDALCRQLREAIAKTKGDTSQ